MRENWVFGCEARRENKRGQKQLKRAKKQLKTMKSEQFCARLQTRENPGSHNLSYDQLATRGRNLHRRARGEPSAPPPPLAPVP